MSKVKLDTTNSKAPKETNRIAYKHELEKHCEELLV